MQSKHYRCLHCNHQNEPLIQFTHVMVHMEYRAGVILHLHYRFAYSSQIHNSEIRLLPEQKMIEYQEENS